MSECIHVGWLDGAVVPVYIEPEGAYDAFKDGSPVKRFVLWTVASHYDTVPLVG
jgi:hypothetical protein